MQVGNSPLKKLVELLNHQFLAIRKFSLSSIVKCWYEHTLRNITWWHLSTTANHLLYERLAPGSRRGHSTSSDRSVGSALHHQLPQVPLLLLHPHHLLLLPLLLLFLPLLILLPLPLSPATRHPSGTCPRASFCTSTLLVW